MIHKIKVKDSNPPLVFVPNQLSFKKILKTKKGMYDPDLIHTYTKVTMKKNILIY